MVDISKQIGQKKLGEHFIQTVLLESGKRFFILDCHGRCLGSFILVQSVIASSSSLVAQCSGPSLFLSDIKNGADAVDQEENRDQQVCLQKLYRIFSNDLAAITHHFPSVMSWMASLILSKGIVWVMNSSSITFLAMYSLTIVGIPSLPLKPEMSQMKPQTCRSDTFLV